MLCKVKGIVLRYSECGENDKLLTLFTHEKGKMTVCIKGGRSLKSKHIPSSEIFCYSEFELYQKGDMYWVRESFLCESFFKIRSNLENMYLGQYFCEVCAELALYDVPDQALLRLLLNSLYLLAENKKDIRIVKSVFELRSASIEGFMPDIEGCSICSNKKGEAYFDAIEGVLICTDCKKQINETQSPQYFYENMAALPILLLDESVLDAMNFIINAPLERSFSFSLPEDELKKLNSVCECFILHQLERGFKTLDLYKMLMKI